MLRRTSKVKRTIGFLVITAVLLLSTLSAGAMQMATLNTQHIDSGILSVQYSVPQNKVTKIMLENGGERKFYNLPADRSEESFALNLGDGQYKVSILEHISGNQYRPVSTETLRVSLKDPTVIYLSSVQEIRWHNEMTAIQKAAELTEGLTTDDEKTVAIYEYVVSNISYDYDKFATISSSYLPDIDDTFVSGQGICYDYSSLFAAMMRSVGVPARMVKGYAPGVSEYHAWNEVLIDGEWKTLDTTMDAAYHQAGHKIEMFKNGAAFSVSSTV